MLQLALRESAHTQSFSGSHFPAFGLNIEISLGVLHSFSIKNIFYDKMYLRLFYFYVTIYFVKCIPEKLQIQALFTESSLTEVSRETKRLLYQKCFASNFLKKL